MSQVDYFLKLDSIDGESTDDQFPKWIQIDSWNWGSSNHPHAATNAGAGKVSLQDFRFSAEVNKTTATLHSYCTSGKHIAKAELDCRKAGDTPQVYLKIVLYDVVVSSCSIGGGQGGGGDGADNHAMESVTLNFAKIEMSYGVQGDNGKVSALDNKMSYDARTNKPGG